MFYALGVVMCWSLGSFGSSRISRAWGAGVANRARLALAFALMGIASSVLLMLMDQPQWAAMLWYLMAGAAHMGLGDLALFASYRAIGPRLGVLLCLCSSAPMALVMEWLILGSRPSWWVILFGAMIMVSVLVALAPTERLRIGKTAILTGVALGLTAGFCQAVARTMERHVKLSEDLIPAHVVHGTSGRLLGGLLICLLVWGLAMFFKVKDVSSDYDVSLQREHADSKNKAWMWLGVSAILGPVIGFQLLHMASETTHGAVVQAVLCLLPMSIIPVAWLLDGDKPSLRSVIGGAFAVAAVIGMAML